MEQEQTLQIRGMTCPNCERRIEEALRQADGVLQIEVSYRRGTARIRYDTDQITEADMAAILEAMDYQLDRDSDSQTNHTVYTVCLLIMILALFIMLQYTGLLNRLAPSQLAYTGMSYGMLWVVGLLTSVHCIAMCGGIPLTQCIPQTVQESGGKQKRKPVLQATLLYNLGRVASYTAIGFGLGLLSGLTGRVGLQLSVWPQGLIKIAAGVWMVLMGINMLNLFPALRKWTLRIPRRIGEKRRSNRKKRRQPFWVGVWNGFMPCGPMQSMWLVALASGNPVSGALSMCLFCLGTVPLMLGFGSAAAALSRKFTHKVMTVGAILIVVMGLSMISQGSAMNGWGISIRQEKTLTAQMEGSVQVAYSTLEAGAYPSITVQAGVPVRWIIEAPQGSINGCNNRILIPELDMEYTFQQGQNIIEFTVDTPGTIHYSCWMGMIHGIIYAVES